MTFGSVPAITSPSLVGPQPSRAGRRRGASAVAKDGPVGWALWAALLWCLFDFGRPPTPPMGPLAITGVLFVWWLAQGRKQFGPSDAWWFVIVGVAGANILMASNTHAAFMGARFFAITLIGVCLPLQTVISSVRRVRVWIVGFIVIATYVGAWAATHSGFGPAGTDGHDENYVAAIVGMGMAFSYFTLLTQRRFAPRLLLLGTMVIFMAAVALAENASRGGFLAICLVGAYAIYRSPRKTVGIVVMALGAGALLLFGNEAFWEEISTSTDYSSGTADLRIEVWKIGVRMWQANPFFGVGAGNLRWRLEEFQSAEQYAKLGRSLGGSIVAHSMHVEMLAEIGGLGVLATGALVWRTWRGLGRMLLTPAQLRRRDIPRHLLEYSHYADGIRAAILVVLVNGVFLSLLYYAHLWVLIAVGTGLIHTHRRMMRREAAARAPAHPVGQPPSVIDR